MRKRLEIEIRILVLEVLDSCIALHLTAVVQCRKRGLLQWFNAAAFQSSCSPFVLLMLTDITSSSLPIIPLQIRYLDLLPLEAVMNWPHSVE